MNKPYRKRRKGQLLSTSSLLGMLDEISARAGRPGEARLVRLWQNWNMVMGPDLAGLAIPLGQRGGVLLVGGEDPMAIQELSLMGAEILERVNAFMDYQFFREVKVGPCFGQKPLDEVCAALAPRKYEAPKPERMADDSYLDSMPPDSPVRRCYARFARKR